MDAFSLVQLQEDTDKRFKSSTDIPTPLLTKGCFRDWLGVKRDPPTTISPTWQQYSEITPFMEAHTTGINEFQTMLPVNITVNVNGNYRPTNGIVISRNSTFPTPLRNRGYGWMLRLVESTLLGSAAGTDESGRALIMYQMQMPSKDDKLRIRSETLEIAYTGKYDLPATPQAKPITIITTLTWVSNLQKLKTGVKERYRDLPYLRITLTMEPTRRLNDESRIWHQAYQKLLHYQLMGPVRQEFGMDLNPVPYFSGLMPRAGCTIDDEGQLGHEAITTNLRLFTFCLCDSVDDEPMERQHSDSRSPGFNTGKRQQHQHLTQMLWPECPLH